MARTTVIGLDIGTTHVRASEVEFGSGGPGRGSATLVRFGQVPLPLGAVRDGEVVEQTTVASALRTLWAQTKFTSKDVVIGVGNQRVVIRELDLPWLPLPELRQSLPYQVQELLPISTDDALLDYYPTAEFDGPNGREVRGMFVAAVKDTVTANVLAVEGAGLRPQMVDLNAFALLRSLAQGEMKSRTVAFIDIGARVTNIVVAVSGVPRFVRTLPAGGQDVTDVVASTLRVTSAEADLLKRDIGFGFTHQPEYVEVAEAVDGVGRTLVDAIRNTLAFYANNNPDAPVELLSLSGGGAHLRGLGQYLSSATRLAAALGNPFERLTVAKGLDMALVRGNESSMALSIGLAYGVAA